MSNREKWLWVLVIVIFMLIITVPVFAGNFWIEKADSANRLARERLFWEKDKCYFCGDIFPSEELYRVTPFGAYYEDEFERVCRKCYLENTEEYEKRMAKAVEESEGKAVCIVGNALGVPYIHVLWTPKKYREKKAICDCCKDTFNQDQLKTIFTCPDCYKREMGNYERMKEAQEGNKVEAKIQSAYTCPKCGNDKLSLGTSGIIGQEEDEVFTGFCYRGCGYKSHNEDDFRLNNYNTLKKGE